MFHVRYGCYHPADLVYTFTMLTTDNLTPTFPLLLWLHQRQHLVVYFTDSRSDCGLVACASFKKGIGVAVGVSISVVLWPVAWLAEDDQDPEQDTNGRK